MAGHTGSDRPGLCLGLEVGALKVPTEHKEEWLQGCFSPSSGYLFFVNSFKACSFCCNSVFFLLTSFNALSS